MFVNSVVILKLYQLCNHMVNQKNEAGSSNACELVGLRRSIDKLGAENISSLVTDRHRGISKYLREEQPNVKHRYDLWHVAKCTETYSARFCYVLLCSVECLDFIREIGLYYKI